MKLKLQQFEGASALLGSAVIYATFGLLIREISKMFGDATQTFVRFAFATALIALVNLAMRKKFRVPRGVVLKTAALGVLFAGLVVLFTISVNATKIANSVFLLYAGSIVSSFLIGTFVLKEQVNRTKIIAIVIALAGLLMYSGAFAALNVGVIAGVCSGLLDGCANALRKSLKSVDRNTVIMYHYGFGSVFALAIVAATGGFAVGTVSLGPILATAVFVVLMLFLSNLLLFGFQHFDVNVGTVILATELFFATIFAFLLYHETPVPNEVVGGCLIFAASIVASVNFAEMFRRRRAKAVA